MKRSDRGDTLIEVLFATTIFSVIAVGTLTLMNQGTYTSQRSLETTMVRQQIDAQADGLRFLHDAYINEYEPGKVYSATTPAGRYKKILDDARASGKVAATPFSNAATTCPGYISGSFVVNTRTGTVVTASSQLQRADSFAEVQYESTTGPVLQRSKGIWIEAVRSPDTSGLSATAGFIDFHIRACWYTIGTAKPMNIGTIVRLYEPRT